MIRVRPGAAGDGLVLGGIPVRAWQDAYRGIMSDAYLDGLSASSRAELWTRTIESPPPGTQLFVAEREGQLLGFAGGGPARGAEAPRSCALSSRPSSRRWPLPAATTPCALRPPGVPTDTKTRQRCVRRLLTSEAFAIAKCWTTSIPTRSLEQRLDLTDGDPRRACFTSPPRYGKLEESPRWPPTRLPISPNAQSTLPRSRFRAACTGVAALYLLLGASMKLRGVHAAMGPFGVPPAILDSAHFNDFFQFLFLHMMVIGLLIGLLGWAVEGARQQRTVARVLCTLELVYTFFDLRTSDSPLGNGLYQGAGSVVPALMDLAVFLAFAWLGTRRLEARAL